MELRRLTVRELVDSSDTSFEGWVELDGFLMYSAADDHSWLSSDADDIEPVVVLSSPEKIRAVLRTKVPALGGGSILYANRAKVIGTLKSDDAGYLLTDISTVEIFSYGEAIRLLMSDLD